MNRLPSTSLALIAMIVLLGACDSDNGAPQAVVESELSILEVVTNDDDGLVRGYLAHLYGHKIGETTLSLLDSATIMNDGANSEDIILEVEIPGYTEVARKSATIPPFSSASVADITPAFDFSKVYSVATSAAANLEVRVLKGGALVAVHSQPITIEPLNRVSWFVRSGGETRDFRLFSLTLITPDAPEVHQIITEAAQYSEHGAMFGYQNLSLENVVDQVKAVWLAIQNRGVVYTNVPGSFFDGAQFVRLPSESLQSNSANCVDGAFLFAAVFEALGMEPIIWFKTGHAFLSVRQGPGNDEGQIYIETTMVSSSTLSDAYEAARDTARAAYEAGDPNLAALDLVRFRSIGITPVNTR